METKHVVRKSLQKNDATQSSMLMRIHEPFLAARIHIDKAQVPFEVLQGSVKVSIDLVIALTT